MTSGDDSIYGRERELARFDEVVAEVAAGGRHTLVVCGSAGIGKTTLVDASARFGAFVALRPRLELARALVEGGSRDEGRPLLVDCWTDAAAMGAGHFERQAAALARHHRVPLRKGAAGAAHRA